MHFLILGGNGRTGQLVVEEGLSRGHTFTALVRNSSSLTARLRLTVVAGSPLNRSDIDTAVRASSNVHSAVIVTLNAPRMSDSPFAKPIAPPRLMTDSVANAIAVMKAHSIGKLVILQAFGVGESFKNNNFLIRAMLRHSNMAAQFEDHDMVADEVVHAGVNYVLARPAMLTNKVAGPIKVHEIDGANAGFMPSVSRKSVAKFLIDASEDSRWDGSAPVVSN